MLSYAAHRVLGLIPVLATAVVLTFIANQFVPGDPIMILLSDQSGDLVLEARLRADYGLDRPLFEQFVSYVSGIFSGDFGLSFRFANVPVIDVISTGLAISPILAISALIIADPRYRDQFEGEDGVAALDIASLLDAGRFIDLPADDALREVEKLRQRLDAEK